MVSEPVDLMAALEDSLAKAKAARWDKECILKNPSTTRNCPYSILCAVCAEDDERG